MIDGFKCYNVNPDICENVKNKGIIFNKNKSGIMSMRGSLHSYFNNGLHNANDFFLSNFYNTLKALYNDYGINPTVSRLNGFEFGVNLILPFNPDKLIDKIIFFKNNCEPLIKTHYKEFGFENYKLKLYNKSALSRVEKYKNANIFRIEISVKKMKHISSQFRCSLLSDLIDKNLWKYFEDILLEYFDNCLLIDYEPEVYNKLNQEEIIRLKNYENIIFWKNIRKESIKKFNSEKKACDRFLANRLKSNLKVEIKKEIQLKCELLRDIEISRSELLQISKLPKFQNGEKYQIDNKLPKIKEEKVNVNFNIPYHCRGCGEIILHPKKNQIYCSATDVGKTAARRCRDKVKRPLLKLKHQFSKINMYPVLFDTIKFIDPDALFILYRQKMIKMKKY